MKTNTELVTWCKSKLGCGYLFGDNGKPITEALIQAKAKQYPQLFTARYINRCRKWIGNKDMAGNLLPGFDCSGLIDVFLGIDLAAKAYYTKAKIKGLIGKMPTNIPGILVFKTNHDGAIDHIGVSDGFGSVIEAKGADFGVVKTKLAGGGWDLWAKCHLINYQQTLGPAPAVIPGIRYGEESKRVAWMQTALNLLGYGLTIDAKFGPATEAAVKSFQKKSGLTVDGSFGPASLAALLEKIN